MMVLVSYCIYNSILRCYLKLIGFSEVQHLLAICEGHGQGNHRSICGQRYEWPGGARDYYASEINDWKWALKEDQYLPTSKLRSKHSFKTETTWHLLHPQ